MPNGRCRPNLWKMLGFGYMLLVMLIIATISIAETSRTYEGIVPEIPVGQEALDMISHD